MTSAPDLNDLRERLRLGRNRKAREERPLFSTAILDRTYRPFRGLVWSFVVHFSLITGAASIPISHLAVEANGDENLQEAVIVDVDEFEDVLLLPILGVSDLPASTPPKKEGLIYPGPQPVASNFVNPTNQIQTILQPSLINPPRLAPMPLPNVVRLAEPKRLAPPPVEPRFRMPDTSSPVVRPQGANAAPFDVTQTGPARPLAGPVIEPRFRMPEITPISNPALAFPNLPTSPALTSSITPLSPPPPKAPEPDPRTGDSPQDLLVLSPTPARRDQPVAVPPGEARGQFSISPEANLSFPGTEPGNRGTASSSPKPEPSVDVPAEREPAPAKDSAPATAPSNPGAGRAFDPFEGITILGGIETPGTSRANRTNSPPEPLQTSYGITILASGGSGGGLPDFGVFGKEQVHTVFIDMRRTIFDTPMSWTAEYAVGQTATAPTFEQTGILALKEDVVLPFPIDKFRPEWPGELPRKFPGRLVIAYAVINTEGATEQLAIKDSPDPALNDAVLVALRKWTFRPARRDGEVVPAKMLLGIPVY
jgi:hypothetical protein